MSSCIPVRLRRQVVKRDQGLCTYCRSAEQLMGITFEVDHIIPEAAGGATTLENLCLTCPTCNRRKADRMSIIDPDTGAVTALFHPLQDAWHEHFSWLEGGATIAGKTAVGRAMIETLQMNRTALVQLRRYWIALGLHPPL